MWGILGCATGFGLREAFWLWGGYGSSSVCAESSGMRGHLSRPEQGGRSGGLRIGYFEFRIRRTAFSLLGLPSVSLNLVECGPGAVSPGVQKRVIRRPSHVSCPRARCGSRLRPPIGQDEYFEGLNCRRRCWTNFWMS